MVYSIIGGGICGFTTVLAFEKLSSVCLLGDVAHVTPNIGQGGAQAIKDAYFLANAIRNEQTPDIFKVFQKKRVKKVNLIVKQSRLMGKMGI